MPAYYVDSMRGCDAADGLSPQTAWKSLERVNQAVFVPGDRLRLAAGSVWEGAHLAPQGDGDPQRPCVVESYGAGPRPAIHAAGTHLAAVDLYNVQGWEVRGLEVTNQGPQRDPVRYGILARLMDYGTARHIVIEDNYVHHVNGSIVKADGETNGGIAWRAEGKQTLSRYIGLAIRNNRIVTCDRVGIFGTGFHLRTQWFPCLEVVIYGNYLEDIGGDGILNIGTDGCIIERNRLLGGRVRDDKCCAGIWPWGSDNTVIRYNEAAYYHGMRDGQGYDCDFNCAGTVHEYNYSHDNDGGFMLVCTPRCTGEHASPNNIGCVSSRIHRCLSVNDKCRTFELCGEIIGTRIEENCLYVGEGMDVPAILCTAGFGEENYPQSVLVSRNIFAARGVMRYGRAGERYPDGSCAVVEDPADPVIRYTNNAYLGNHPNPPQDAGKPVASPSLEEIEAVVLDENGRAKPGLETLDAFLDLMGWPKA